jgi:phosphoglycolate phosphatase-like HAD superfamily hydrolase
MTAIHLRRGPWGVIQAEWPEAAQADARIESLLELLGVLNG